MERPYHFGSYAAIGLIAASVRCGLKDRVALSTSGITRGYINRGLYGTIRGAAMLKKWSKMPEPRYVLRRTNPRFPFFADAEMNVEDGVSVRAQVSELSSRGCYVDALQSVPVGSKLDLNICYGTTTCQVKGKVIYNHSGGGLGIFGMGVVFRELDSEQHGVINGWLSQLAGQGRLATAEQSPNAPNAPYGKTLPPRL